ncbi:MAG: SOS response-associated peptidase [archaeon]|jgi:putative SOS response-associated peptidase YedK
MCGRFSFIPGYQTLLWEFGEIEFIKKPEANYNVAPQQFANVIQKTDKVVMDKFEWGYEIGARKVINTRLDSLKEKTIFHDSFKNRRVLVPASGYFEWKQAGTRKVPYYFHPKEGYFGLAGIYDKENRFSIITTNADKKIESIHERMPVIVKREDYSKWLDQKTDVKDLLSILGDTRKDLQFDIVSTDVNNVKNNSPDLIEPVKGLF